jgi:proteasome activator subunit 4
MSSLSVCAFHSLNVALLTSIFLVQILEDEPFPALRPTLDKLISDQEPDKQRALAEFIGGLIEGPLILLSPIFPAAHCRLVGSKHWPLSKQHELWQWFQPVMVDIFSQKLKTDTVTIWASFLEVCA